MKIVTIIARILLGLMFFVFGLNPFLKFLPMLQLEGVWGQSLGALFVSHYVWLVGATQVVSGVLLLIGRYVPLAIALNGPVIVNIIAYHVTMQTSELSPRCWRRSAGYSVLAVSRFVSTTVGGEDGSKVVVGVQSRVSPLPLSLVQVFLQKESRSP